MRLAPLVVALVLTGCLAPITERLRASDVEAPEWRVGDWWTYRLTSQLYNTEAEVTVVVANVTADGYVLGTPADADASLGLLQHLPAIGPVRDDLSWDVHEARFEPLRFPLADGKEWDTTWISSTVHLTARFENGTWNVTNAGFEQEALMRYDITYDPAVGWFTSFVRTGLDGTIRQSLELIGNGTGYQDPVRTVGNIRVAFLGSRTQGSFSGGLPTAPNPTFTVPAGTDTLLVGCIVGGGAGRYHAEVLAPDGASVCALDETIPPNDAFIRVAVSEAPAAEGEWEARLVAGGQGSSVAEVLAYATDVTDIA